MELFLTIAFTHFIALLTPGVDFFLILKTMMQGGKRAAKYVCVGIFCGNVVILFTLYFSLFLLGKLNTDILVYLRYFGACYLIYLALQCFKALKIKDEIQPKIDQNRVKTTNKSFFRNFILGLSSSLFNPKNIMFYTTLVILIYSEYTFIQNLLVCIWMAVVVLFWNLGIVQLLNQKFYADYLNRNVRYLYGISGVCFAIFALILLI